MGSCSAVCECVKEGAGPAKPRRGEERDSAPSRPSPLQPSQKASREGATTKHRPWTAATATAAGAAGGAVRRFLSLLAPVARLPFTMPRLLCGRRRIPSVRTEALTGQWMKEQREEEKQARLPRSAPATMNLADQARPSSQRCRGNAPPLPGHFCTA